MGAYDSLRKDLSMNGVSRMGALRTLVHLQTLCLDGNQLEVLEGLQSLQALRTLRVARNRLVDAQQLLLAGACSLQSDPGPKRATDPVGEGVAGMCTCVFVCVCVCVVDGCVQSG